MNLTPISISTRACSEEETQALSLWSASFLPRCRNWTAQRGLHPPADVLENVQQVRMAGPDLSPTMLKPLLMIPSPGEQQVAYTENDASLAALATDLSHDLGRYQELIAHLGPQEHTGRFLTESRDLRRFQRAMSQFHLDRIEIVASEPMIVPLFSLRRKTLYIPRWLLQTLPRTMFAPNPSFYRARTASLVWLLLDAIVVTTTNEFKTI